MIRAFVAFTFASILTLVYAQFFDRPEFIVSTALTYFALGRLSGYGWWK